jgi:hypothetical protein
VDLNSNDGSEFKPRWIGAVNNAGSMAVFHCKDEFYYDLHEHTVGRTDNVEMLRKGKYIMHSPVYVWKAQTGECRNIDIAKVCAEELLEISIEKEDPLNRHHRFYENN